MCMTRQSSTLVIRRERGGRMHVESINYLAREKKMGRHKERPERKNEQSDSPGAGGRGREKSMNKEKARGGKGGKKSIRTPK